MTTVLENVERDLNSDSNVTKYAQPRHRLALPGNGELENIQSGLRKWVTDGHELHRQLVAYGDNLKTALDSVQRGIG
jgi:hypothetical protein